jgi:Family of unknown function (DUF6011)
VSQLPSPDPEFPEWVDQAAFVRLPDEPDCQHCGGTGNDDSTGWEHGSGQGEGWDELGCLRCSDPEGSRCCQAEPRPFGELLRASFCRNCGHPVRLRADQLNPDRPVTLPAGTVGVLFDRAERWADLIADERSVAGDDYEEAQAADLREFAEAGEVWRQVATGRPATSPPPDGDETARDLGLRTDELPPNWCEEFLEKTAHNPYGRFAWSYDNASASGRPLPLDEEARGWLDEFEAEKSLADFERQAARALAAIEPSVDDFLARPAEPRYTHCRKCGRLLSDEASKRSGYGPECRRQARQAGRRR